MIVALAVAVFYAELVILLFGIERGVLTHGDGLIAGLRTPVRVPSIPLTRLVTRRPLRSAAHVTNYQPWRA